MDENYGRKIYKLLVGVVVVVATVGLFWYVHRQMNDDSADRQSPLVKTSCAELLNTVLTRERVGDTAGVINEELDELGDRCPSEYDTYVDYVVSRGMNDLQEQDVNDLKEQDEDPCEGGTWAAQWECEHEGQSD